MRRPTSRDSIYYTFWSPSIHFRATPQQPGIRSAIGVAKYGCDRCGPCLSLGAPPVLARRLGISPEILSRSGCVRIVQWRHVGSTFSGARGTNCAVATPVGPRPLPGGLLRRSQASARTPWLGKVQVAAREPLDRSRGPHRSGRRHTASSGMEGVAEVGNAVNEAHLLGVGH